MNVPEFTAEASFYRSSAHYQVGARLAGLRQERKGIIHPALFDLHCGIKTCCLFLGLASLPMCVGIGRLERLSDSKGYCLFPLLI